MKEEPETDPEPPCASPDVAAAVDVEVPAKPRRRTFTAEYKLRILREVDAAPAGTKGAILRREGLYTSHVSEWRTARREGGLNGLARKRGRKPNPSSDANKKIARLERELARTQEELRKAHLIVEVQGKVAGLLGLNFVTEKSS